MTSASRSFDRAADIYDQTRELPGSYATQGIQTILDIAGPGAHLLEVGVGTGRISLPLLQRGADVIGCDLSSRMMARFRDKLPSARLVQSDAAQLPFPPHQFDALLTIHVLHLVGPWREALREFSRVVKPGGVYIHSGSRREEDSPHERIRAFWRSRVEARWTPGPVRPGIKMHVEVLEELRALGAEVTEVEAARATRALVPREQIDMLAARVLSETWDVPDDVLDAAVQETRAWAEREFGDLDQKLEREVPFILDVARFSPADAHP
jgi:ubiquinone/menaquinone biosynthesis C-methylase UbiE